MSKKRFLLAVAVAVIAVLAAILGGTAPAAQKAATAKIGLVSDVGRFNDRSFNQSALDGLQRSAF